MHRFTPAHALWAAASMLAAGPALASSTATTTLADFQIWLTDLSPSDGVAPTLVLDPRSRSTVIPGEVSAGGSASWMQQGDSAFGPVSASGDLGGTGGSGSFSGDPLGAGAQIAASATGGPSLDIGSSVAFVDTPASDQGGFVLGAQTQVTFYGSVSIDWSASNPDAATYGEADLAFWQFIGDGQDLVAQAYVTGGYYSAVGGALSGTVSSPLAITFANDSDASVVMGYEVAVFANASELELALPPVDEPDGAALLLAGVATALWGLRQRSRGVAARRVRCLGWPRGPGPGRPSRPSACGRSRVLNRGMTTCGRHQIGGR